MKKNHKSLPINKEKACALVYSICLLFHCHFEYETANEQLRVSALRENRCQIGRILRPRRLVNKIYMLKFIETMRSWQSIRLIPSSREIQSVRSAVLLNWIFSTWFADADSIDFFTLSRQRDGLSYGICRGLNFPSLTWLSFHCCQRTKKDFCPLIKIENYSLDLELRKTKFTLRRSLNFWRKGKKQKIVEKKWTICRPGVLGVVMLEVGSSRCRKSHYSPTGLSYIIFFFLHPTISAAHPLGLATIGKASSTLSWNTKTIYNCIEYIMSLFTHVQKSKRHTDTHTRMSTYIFMRLY